MVDLPVLGGRRQLADVAAKAPDRPLRCDAIDGETLTASQRAATDLWESAKRDAAPDTLSRSRGKLATHRLEVRAQGPTALRRPTRDRTAGATDRARAARKPVTRGPNGRVGAEFSRPDNRRASTPRSSRLALDAELGARET